MYRGTVCFDIDGVLADFEGRFCQIFGNGNRHLYELEERFTGEIEKIKEIKKTVNDPNLYYGLEPIQGGIEFLKSFIDRDYHVIIATGRPKASETMTRRWLNNYCVPFMKLIFTTDKANELHGMGQNLSYLKTDILVDDNPKVLEECDDYFIQPLCWKQEWNEYFYPKVWWDEQEKKVMYQEYDETNPISEYWKER